jgi:regulator of protease activity HflC (stomatin/prohibitin superfamily)
MLDWLTKILDLIISFVPRMVKIRKTHGGVRWPRCGEPVEMKPGISVVWPLVTDWEVVVVARQTEPLPPQSLTLADGTQVTVKGICVYSICDVVAAFGERNWDISSTVGDLSLAAISEVVCRLDKEKIKHMSKVSAQITRRARAKLEEYGVRVEKCSLIEISLSRTIRLLADGDKHHVL